MPCTSGDEAATPTAAGRCNGEDCTDEDKSWVKVRVEGATKFFATFVLRRGSGTQVAVVSKSTFDPVRVIFDVGPTIVATDVTPNGPHGSLTGGVA